MKVCGEDVGLSIWGKAEIEISREIDRTFYQGEQQLPGALAR